MGRHKYKEPEGVTREIVNKLIALRYRGMLRWGGQLELAKE